LSLIKADKLDDNDVAEYSGVLECDAMSLGQWLPTFQKTAVPSKDQELLSQ
jgi:succinate dehydrogenase flavin-adding protein (antitoxin of CptAB toxin-antitoxin module)